MESQIRRISQEHRRKFISGSRARIIIGAEEKTLLRVCRQNRCEAEPANLPANLIVSLVE